MSPWHILAAAVFAVSLVVYLLARWQDKRKRDRRDES